MPPTTPSAPVDFDFHGIVRVRLVDAGPRDVATLQRQLGPMQAAVAGDADITCRFVDRLPLGSRIRLIGLDDAGWTDDAYLVLRSRHKARTRVSIPMADIGGPCEIVCERGVPAVPLLIAIVNLTALVRGYVPIHASAAVHRDLGILIAGWAKGGKTELLLGIMADGGHYVGDEWVYVDPDSHEMFGIPEPMKIWAAHLEAMPRYRSAISAADRIRLASLRRGSNVLASVARTAPRSAVTRPVRRIAYVADQQASVHVPPATLFGEEHCRLRGRLDRLVLTVSTESPEVTLEPTKAADVARRMTHSVQHERLDLVAHYLKFRFAFPGATNPHLEAAEDRQAHLLASALGDTPAAVLAHPYPAPIPAMFERLDAWLR